MAVASAKSWPGPVEPLAVHDPHDPAKLGFIESLTADRGGAIPILVGGEAFMGFSITPILALAPSVSLIIPRDASPNSVIALRRYKHASGQPELCSVQL